MTVDKIIADAEFGHLYIKTNVRAVRYTFRPADDGSPQCGILITVPNRYVLADVLRSVKGMRTELRRMLQKHQEQKMSRTGSSGRPRIDLDFRIEAECLYITLVQGTRQGFFLHHEEGEFRRNAATHDVEVIRPAQMQLVCPPGCDFLAEGRQAWLEKAITEGIRTHAKVQLLPRLKDYARLYGIKLHETKINSSKGRWGSCTQHVTRGFYTSDRYYNINLSLFTLLLPLRLQKLIILHELTHTRHMDHSDAFHHDLDVWLGGKEKTLEQELKCYNTSIFLP